MNSTMLLAREEADELLDDVADGWRVVANERSDEEDSRWTSTWRIIFQRPPGGDFWELLYDRPLTEMQEVDPFENYVDIDDNILCHRVHRTLVSVVHYERVER